MSKIFNGLNRIFRRKTKTSPPKQIYAPPKINNAPPKRNIDLQNSANFIHKGDVRIVTEDFQPRNMNTSIQKNDILIITFKYDNVASASLLDETNRQCSFTYKELLYHTSVHPLFGKTITPGTNLIVNKQFEPEDEDTNLYNIIKDTILTVDSISLNSSVVENVLVDRNFYNLNPKYVFTVHINDNVFDYSFTLNSNELFYTTIQEIQAGGNRKTNTFLKKQRKSKKNYMRALRNFITRKRL